MDDNTLPTQLVDPDNAGPQYIDYRQQAANDDIFAKTQQWLQEPTKPGEAAPASAAPIVPATPAAPAKPKTMIEALVNPGPGGMPPQDPIGTMGKVLPDLAKGVVEAPRAIASGFLRAAGNLWATVAPAVTGLGIGAAGGDPLLMGGKTLSPQQMMDLQDKMAPALEEQYRAAGNYINPPKSVTGNVVSGVAQFIAASATSAGMLKSLGMGGAAANVAGGGVSMATAFDPMEATLAETIQAQPDLANPVTAFLASKPGDSKAEMQLKNGLEGLLTGGALEGFTRALSYYKEAKAPIPQEGATPAPSEVELPSLQPSRDFMLLGDPKAPLVKVGPKSESPVAKIGAAMEKVGGVDQGAAASGLVKDAQTVQTPIDYGNTSVSVNFAKINTADDVKKVLGQMTEAFSPEISEAQRGVRSNAETAKAAQALGMTPEDVLKRRFGQPFNAEESLAARQLMTASGEKLLQVAKVAASPNATPADQFMFRKMMATHYAIQSEVLGARTETARALQAWSIPAGSGQEQFKALQQILSSTGGSDVSQAMAKRLSLLAEANPNAIPAAIRKGALATTMDAVREVWINGLLSSPTTHIVNTASNFSVAMQQIGERYIAGKLAQMSGSGGVADGEAQAMMYGLVQGQWDAFRSGANTLLGKTGQKAWQQGKLETPRIPSVSSQAFNLDAAGGTGRTVDFLGNVLRIPGKLLDTSDTYFKSIGYRMELNAQAYRQATSEGLEGKAFGARVADIVNNPPSNIRLASADAALYSTFSNENGWFGQQLSQLRNKGGAMNPIPFILPFVRTPVNIARYAFERTPLAPLVGQWRADFAAGGARRDIALARMATGSAAMAVASDLSMQGKVSGKGPSDPGQRDALMRIGWRPYSVQVGDKWFSYNRADPFGQTLGFAADMTEALNTGDVDPQDVPQWDQAMAGGIAAVSQFTVNKTYLQGLADFAQMMTDPKRYGKGYIDNFAGSLLPATSALGAAERFEDPTSRIADTPMQAAMAKIPGLSANLTPRRDLWGQEIKPDAVYGVAYDVLSPVGVSKVKDSPIDQEMLKQQVYQTTIPKSGDWNGVPVNFRNFPKVYDEYVRLAGNGLKLEVYDGKGAKDYLNDLVSGKAAFSEIYRQGSNGSDGSKANLIRSTIQEYRRSARDEIMRDPKFKDFQAYVARAQQQQQQKALENLQ